VSAAADFGIYVHWPYCAAICPYCDFNVYRERGHERSALRAAIAGDMRAHAERFGRRQAGSLYFGGGTPSLLSGVEVAELIAAARGAFELAPDCEISLEANPEHFARFADFAAAGISRISLGAQALDDAALKALGRAHDAKTVKQAVDSAAAAGLRVSLDLIYAREGQGSAAWRAELSEALRLPIEHLSLYQLTIEPGTAFARKLERGALHPPGLEEAAALYELTQEICAAAGFPAYEISNHARGEGARARHNLIYWRAGDWAGIGPGAHGRFTHDGARIATEAQRRPEDYIDAVQERATGWLSQTELTPREQADELLIMGLRVDEGVDIARLQALRGEALNPAARAMLLEQGFLEDDPQRLRLTPRGRLLANKVAAELAV
jgi:oxygen-independent coproporphyrinogen-3 oxidase